MAVKRFAPLADLVAPVLGTAIARQGFAGADILVSWPDIAGERLAAVSHPLKIEWPRRRAAEGAHTEPGTLVVRVEGAFAIELQHLAPLIVERVNGFYGWRCVGRLVLKQAPIARRALPAPPRPALSPAREKDLAGRLAPIETPELRAALDRLGRAVLAGSGDGTGPSVAD